MAWNGWPQNLPGVPTPTAQPSRRDDVISAGFLKDAIVSGDLNRVNSVLGSVNPNAKDMGGVPVISYAITLDDSDTKRRILIALLLAGGDINKATCAGRLFNGGKLKSKSKRKTRRGGRKH
jgi:hypothetical protein